MMKYEIRPVEGYEGTLGVYPVDGSIPVYTNPDRGRCELMRDRYDRMRPASQNEIQMWIKKPVV